MDILQGLVDGDIIVSGERLWNFMIRLIANIISTFILIRFIYYPKNSRINYLFLFFMMGMMIFLIASILDQVSLNMGMALGLFAIFGIVRFRSPSIELKELTYLFLVIGLSVINALVEFHVAAWFGLFIANFLIIISSAIMEKYRPKNHVLKRMMVISNTDFSVLNNNERLLQEVRELTGIDVLKVDIVKINKIKNEITIWISFDGYNKEYRLSQEQPPEPPEEQNQWESDYSNEY